MSFVQWGDIQLCDHGVFENVEYMICILRFKLCVRPKYNFRYYTFQKKWFGLCKCYILLNRDNIFINVNEIWLFGKKNLLQPKFGCDFSVNHVKKTKKVHILVILQWMLQNQRSLIGFDHSNAWISEHISLERKLKTTTIVVKTI